MTCCGPGEMGGRRFWLDGPAGGFKPELGVFLCNVPDIAKVSDLSNREKFARISVKISGTFAPVLSGSV